MRGQANAYAKRVVVAAGQSAAKIDPPEAVYPRANVTPLEVYKRPTATYRYERSQGASHDEAVDAARERLKSLLGTDLQRASVNEQTRAYTKTAHFEGYRRVIHPEMSESFPHSSCGLCIVASTRLYKKKELMAMHGGCHCGTLPVYGSSDMGWKLNEDDLNSMLQRLYKAAGGTDAGSLRDVRVRDISPEHLGQIVDGKGVDLEKAREISHEVVDTYDHGELGPTLIPAGQNVRDASDAGAPEFSPPDAAKTKRDWDAMRAEAESYLATASEVLNAQPGQKTLRWPDGRTVETSTVAASVRSYKALIRRANNRSKK